MAISKEVYSQLREQFWDVASWALWTPPIRGPKDNVGDLSVFDTPDLLEKLNGDYMFVALCGSGVHEPYLDKSAAWFNFHSSSPRGQDYKLRDATVGTPTQGSYITDIIKYHAELDAKAAVRYVKSHPDLLEKNLSAITKEIELLGGNPTLIALGNDSYNLIKTYLPGRFRVLKIHHYSASVREGQMKSEIMSGLGLKK